VCQRVAASFRTARWKPEDKHGCRRDGGDDARLAQESREPRPGLSQTECQESDRQRPKERLDEEDPTAGRVEGPVGPIHGRPGLPALGDMGPIGSNLIKNLSLESAWIRPNPTAEAATRTIASSRVNFWRMRFFKLIWF